MWSQGSQGQLQQDGTAGEQSLDQDDIVFKLLLNLPIDIDGAGCLTVPTLRLLAAWGEKRYNEALSALLFDKEQHEPFRTLAEDNYSLMCVLYEQDERYRSALADAIHMLLGCRLQLQRRGAAPGFVLQDGEGERALAAKQLEEIRHIARVAHRLEEQASDYNPANAAARKMVELLSRSKRSRPAGKQAVNLQSIISGVAWKSSSINLLHIGELTLYQLYDGYRRLHSIDSSNHTCTGIYAGTIDSKAIKLSELNWAAILH